MGRDPVQFPDGSVVTLCRRGSLDSALGILLRQRGRATVGVMPEPAYSEPTPRGSEASRPGPGA
jgi:hypothetical protein